MFLRRKLWTIGAIAFLSIFTALLLIVCTQFICLVLYRLFLMMSTDFASIFRLADTFLEGNIFVYLVCYVLCFVLGMKHSIDTPEGFILFWKKKVDLNI